MDCRSTTPWHVKDAGEIYKTLEAPKSMPAGRAVALRQGEERVIHASELVPGDIVFLEDGAITPADVRLLDSSSLKRLSEGCVEKRRNETESL